MVLPQVVNIEGNTHLYLFVNGYQRLAQSLLQGTYEKPDAQSYAINDVAPSLQKKLIAIGIGNGSFEQSVERANCLATKQAARFSGVQSPPAPQCGPVDPKEPIRMKFEDGSFTSSSIAYLTPLPYDMLAIDGMQPWCEVIKKVAVPNLAFKANLVWNNFSIAKALNLTPCVEIENGRANGGYCDRLILDGPKGGDDPQLVRQAWLWDDKQILLYSVGSEGSPAANAINKQAHNMTDFVHRVVNQIQDALPQNITIPRPAWVRTKSQPMGALMSNWATDLTTDQESEANELFRRPFGDEVRVFYGNSEMAKNGNNHGWAEGAFEMANQSLPEIVDELRKLG